VHTVACHFTPLLNLCCPIFSWTFQSIVTALLTNRFKIWKFRMVLTLPLCVLYGSQNNQQLLSCTALTDWFCITEAESVYRAVCTEPVYIRRTFFFKRLAPFGWLHSVSGNSVCLMGIPFLIDTFWFTPTSYGTHLVHGTRAGCIWFSTTLRACGRYSTVHSSLCTWWGQVVSLTSSSYSTMALSVWPWLPYGFWTI